MIKTPLVIIGKYGMLGQDLDRVFSDLDPIMLDKEDVDITDAQAVEQKLEEIQPGTVINAAAYNAVDAAEEEPGATIVQKVNADGPKNLAETCAKLSATFVQYSTDYVFEGVKKEGYTEEDMTNPQSNYARAKRDGEVATLKNGGYVIRTCKLFGKPGAAEVSKKSFVDTMLELAKSRDSLDVVDDEFGSPTYTPDLSAQTRLLLEGEYEPGVYHITNAGGATWFDWAKEIFRITQKDIELNAVGPDAFPRAAARPEFSVLLNTKLPAMRTWQEALEEYLQSK